MVFGWFRGTYTLPEEIRIDRTRDIKLALQPWNLLISLEDEIPLLRRHERLSEVRLREHIQRNIPAHQSATLLSNRPLQNRHLRILPIHPPLRPIPRQRDPIRQRHEYSLRSTHRLNQLLRRHIPHALHLVVQVRTVECFGSGVPVLRVNGTGGGGEQADGHLAAEHDGAAEGRRGAVAVQVDIDGERAGGLAPDGEFVGVAAEGAGVGLSPFDGEALVVEAEVFLS